MKDKLLYVLCVLIFSIAIYASVSKNTEGNRFMIVASGEGILMSSVLDKKTGDIYIYNAYDKDNNYKKYAKPQ